MGLCIHRPNPENNNYDVICQTSVLSADLNSACMQTATRRRSWQARPSHVASYHEIATAPLPDGRFVNCCALRHLDFCRQWLTNCVPKIAVAFRTRCLDFILSNLVFITSFRKVLASWFYKVHQRLLPHYPPLNVCGLAVNDSWLSRVRFPAQPVFQRRRGSGMGSTQPREYNWGVNGVTCVAEKKCFQWGTNWIFKYYLGRSDLFCGLVARVPAYRSRGLGSFTGVTRFSK
jgi:hypothetical protein